MTNDERSMTPRLQAVMTRAAAIAQENGIGTVGVEHVVLAALEDERSVPAQVLSQQTDVAALRSALEEALRSSGYRGIR